PPPSHIYTLSLHDALPISFWRISNGLSEGLPEAGDRRAEIAARKPSNEAQGAVGISESVSRKLVTVRSGGNGGLSFARVEPRRPREKSAHGNYGVGRSQSAGDAGLVVL